MHKYLIAFGGQGDNNSYSKVVEKYNIRANVWQALPDLNIGRRNPSGFIINDNFYVLGGQMQPKSYDQMHESCLMIEKVNLKNNHLTKFELLEI